MHIVFIEEFIYELVWVKKGTVLSRGSKKHDDPTCTLWPALSMENSGTNNMHFELKANVHQENNLTLLKTLVLKFLKFCYFLVFLGVAGSNGIPGLKLYKSRLAVFLRYLLMRSLTLLLDLNTKGPLKAWAASKQLWEMIVADWWNFTTI